MGGPNALYRICGLTGRRTPCHVPGEYNRIPNRSPNSRSAGIWPDFFLALNSQVWKPSKYGHISDILNYFIWRMAEYAQRCGFRIASILDRDQFDERQGIGR